MANANKPMGLSPVKYLNGSDWDGRGNMYFVGSANTDQLSIGDPVTLTGSGDTVRGIPGIQRATAGATAVGVLLAIGINPDGGPYIDPNNLTLVQAPATKLVNYYALVADDPNIIFECQEVSGGTQLAATNIGQNCNWLAANPATGVRLSAFMLDNTTNATTSTLNVKLLGLARRSDNAFGAYAKWLCLINNHYYRVGTTGI